MSGQSLAYKYFFLSLLCFPMWKGWGKGPTAVSAHLWCDISIQPVGHSTWQSKVFILLCQCKPNGQKAHCLSFQRSSPWRTCRSWQRSYTKAGVSLTPCCWDHHQPCCKAHNHEQIYRKVVEGAIFHSTVAQNTTDFLFRYPHVPPILPSIRPKAALLRIRTSSIAPAEKQDCESETLVSQGLLLQWRWVPLPSCLLVYILPS